MTKENWGILKMIGGAFLISGILIVVGIFSSGLFSERVKQKDQGEVLQSIEQELNNQDWGTEAEGFSEVDKLIEGLVSGG